MTTTKPMEAAELLTIDGAAAQLHVSRDWVRKAIKDGFLDGVKVGTGTKRFKWLVSQDEINRYIKQQTRQHDREILKIAKMECRLVGPSRYVAKAAAARARLGI